MADKLYDTNRQIPREEWVRFCDSFTEENQGRLISIELVGSAIGDEPLARDVPFSSIDYDTLSKGNDIILSFGSEAPLTMHTVSAPVELWLTEDNETGKTTAMEITDETGRKVIVKFIQT